MAAHRGTSGLPAPQTSEDTLASLEARYAREGGASEAEVDAALNRAAREEEAATWALLEVRGCRAAHAFPRCSDSCVSADLDVDDRWLGEPAGLPEGNAAEVGLHLAAALEALNRRSEAIAALARAVARDPSDARVRLARAKLQFRSGLKTAAGNELGPLLDSVRRSNASRDASSNPSPPCEVRCDARVAGDAFYIGGWVHVHADDHTAAYSLWCEGAGLLPSDERLARQARKVATWAALQGGVVCEGGSLEGTAARLLQVPQAAAPLSPDWARIVLSDTAAAAEPALRLFEPTRQQGCIAVLTRSPLLQRDECAAVCQAVEAHISEAFHGVWGTVRRSTVPTTDIAVEDVPALVPWLRSLLARRVFPLVAAAFPRLADGSDLGGAAGARLRVHDAFIVRYDAARGSLLLPEHSDTSAVSVTVALNQRGEDFEGGGLWLRAAGAAVEPDAGCAVAFAGPLRHGGAPVSSGARMILVLFLYVEGFAYGHLLQHCGSLSRGAITGTGHTGGGSSGVAGAAADPGDVQRALEGFVVYRETVQLMEALESAAGV